jgi:hypothetical protein
MLCALFIIVVLWSSQDYLVSGIFLGCDAKKADPQPRLSLVV